MNNLTIIVPDDAQIIEIAKQATAQHLHLITNGRRSCLSPIVPDGWQLQMSCESNAAKKLAEVTA